MLSGACLYVFRCRRCRCPDGDQEYIDAIDRIWENVVTKKLYITGGIGATGSGEAFGKNYELPNMSAYCETCAAIGNVYWNYRLFLLKGDAKYYDVLERTLYNGVLSGISLDGGAFFYPNPLESIGQHQRSPWFGCACCPSNACRFIPSVPGYIYAVKDKEVYVNLFVANERPSKSPEESRIETVHLLSLERGYTSGRDSPRNFRFCDENPDSGLGAGKGRTERFVPLCRWQKTRLYSESER